MFVHRGGVDTAPTEQQADDFVRDWMAAWNAHDADAIAAHYADTVEYHSPFVAQLAGAPFLSGRDAVRGYIAAALERYPELHFDPPIAVAVGAGSLSIVYRSVNDLLAVETLVFNEHGRVVRAHCHYRATAE
jgi:hypothetical protein